MARVVPGYRRCPAQPDGWYQRAPEAPFDEQAGHSVSISPGYWNARDAAPKLARSLLRWTADLRRWNASPAPFHLVDSFNHWPEGTAVESGGDWTTPSGLGAYLDVLRSSAAPLRETD